MKKYAFTLVEMLVSITIVMILASLILPLVSYAKTSAFKTQSISQMKQIATSAIIYAEGSDYAFPSTEYLNEDINGIDCDPNDYWRKSCDTPPYEGFVGSYVYFEKFGVSHRLLFPIKGNVTLLISPYYSKEKIPPFEGDQSPISQQEPYGSWNMPDHVLAAKSDGSVKFASVRHDPEDLLSWSSLFYLLDTKSN